jgi:hypothetical protein
MNEPIHDSFAIGVHRRSSAAILLLFLLPLALQAQPPHLTTFNDDGAWNWFQDERVVASAGKLFLASVAAGAHDPNRTGAIEITSYDPAHEATARFTLHQPQTTAERKQWLNDHACPALVIREDGRILAMYSLHGAEPKLYYRISSKPADISAWSEEHIFVPSPAARITFPNLLSLSGRLYAFFRGLDKTAMPSSAFSDDGGVNWSTAGTWNRPQPIPYVKYATDGRTTIHLAFSTGHHLDYGNAIYHAKLRAGEPFTSEGATQVYRANLTSVAWIHDLHVDAEGRPFLAFSVQRNSANLPPAQRAEDHRYHYARWTGARWQEHEIAYGGSRIHTFMDGDDCTGLVALDPQDPASLYISTNADPATGNPLMSRADGKRHWEIFHGETRDGGSTWGWTPLTADSTVDNIRPVVPIWPGRRGVVVWLRGAMRHYIDYDLQVVGTFFDRH